MLASRLRLATSISRETAIMAIRKHDGQEIFKGMAAGAIGGLLASWTMNQFQSGLKKASQALQKGKEQQQQPRQEQPQSNRQSESESEDSTMKTAEWISEGLFHRQLSRPQKKKLGPVVHYATGTVMGAAYGAISELVPQAAVADGAVFGAALFAGLDELGLWALKLAGPPTKYPLSSHAQALASHCVYGVATDTVRRSLRHVW
jgi:putative membrane protein